MKKLRPKKVSQKYINAFLVILLLVAGMFLMATNPDDIKNNVNSKTTYPFQEWKLGEIVDDKKLVFAAYGISEDEIGAPGFWAPASDEKFLLVSMSFKNKTGEVYQMSPINSMKLIDDQNNTYPVTSGPSITKGLGGPVENLTTMSGQVGFLVKKSSKNLKLKFDPQIIDENIITVDLYNVN